MIYTISDLTKIYGARTVLDIPRLEIEKEHIYALLGPNGAGKTTLLNILGLLEAPTAGQVQYCSRPIRYSESELQSLRKEVVVVDQHPILFTTTVYKNLEFGLKIRKIPKKERARIIDESLDMVGVRYFSKALAPNLSGGETQRVALARALALSPKVLLCDEPTSSVDIENQNIIINILRRINEIKKITVLFTTHDRSQAARLAQHTIVLNHGKLVPTMYENIFRGVLQQDQSGQVQYIIHDKIHLPITQDHIKNRNGAVSVFIDPEKIELILLAEDQSNRKALHGRVVQMIEENGKIRVVVDAGVWIALLISKKRYDETRPLVGEYIGIRISAEAIQLL
ncbi:MAG: ABC transporter ATP-binding protein [Desulfobacterales bacterium]|nr:MAG: ABC transporter ATP-binding protein [Desulfobacterales bacterium]